MTRHSLVAVAALLACGVSHAGIVPVDLSGWSERGPAANGNWVVAPGGLSVTQTINGNPTFFVSPDSFSNTVLRGRLRVNTTGDNDFVGFVMGYQTPAGTGTDMDFVLFDWKQADQSGSREGFALSRVQGNITDYDPGFWRHIDSAEFDVLGTNYSSTNGWADNTEYSFEIGYFANRVTVQVSGGVYASLTTVLDVAGNFPAGAFGFYNFSQSQVNYSGFTVERVPPDPNPVSAPGTYGLALAGLMALGAFTRRRRTGRA
jgi:hypothetical protein